MATRRVPTWKLIPGSGFVVDGFRHAGAPGIRAFFLSHAHSDHYTGLSDRWDQGEIYCNETTARLVVHLLGVPSQYICVLPMDQPTMVQGVEVTLVDANHCPGAVQFLFRLSDGRRFLHCGDMRYRPELTANPHIASFQGCDAVFLDTTYCHPKHRFPSQGESVDFVVDTIGKCLEAERAGGPSHLFVISTYTIGKESILKAVARQYKLRIECSQRKMDTLRCLGMDDSTLAEMFTSEEGGGRVLLASWGCLGETWPFFRPNWTKLEALKEGRGAGKAVGFVPTGWTYKANSKEFPVHTKDNLTIHLVPYSEHSSFEELQDYVRFLRPKQVIPTVGVGGDNGEKNRDKMLKHFRNLVDMQSSKMSFVQSLQRPSQAPTQPKSGEQLQLTHAAKEIGAGAGVVEILDDDDFDIVASPVSLSSEPCTQEAGCVRPPATEVPGGHLPQAIASYGNGPEAPVDTMLAVVGQEMSRQSAEALIRLADNDVGRAINMHYDGKAHKPLTTKVPDRKRGPPGSTGGHGAKSRRTSDGGGVQGQSSITAFFTGGSRSSASTSAVTKAGSRQICSQGSQGAGSQEDVGPSQGSQPAAQVIALLTPVVQESQEAAHPSTRHVIGSADAPGATTQPEVDGEDSGAAVADVRQSPSGTAAPTRAFALPPAPRPGASSSRRQQTENKGTAEKPVDITMDPRKYQPEVHACWKPGEPVPYLHLARTFSAVIGTTKRLAIRDAFTNCFRAVLQLSPEELLPVVYLSCGKLAPDHENVELSVGGSTMSSAIVEATGTSRARVREMYKELGDIGDVAQSCRRNQVMLRQPRPLTTAGVYSTLRRIASEKGSGSASRRQVAVLELLRSAREEEPRFLVRMMVQNLRVGASWRSVLGALGRAAELHHREADAARAAPTKEELDAADTATLEAFHVCPSLDVLVPALLRGRPCELADVCILRPGLPIKPMLAKAAEGPEEVVRLIGGAGCLLAEYKYDGQRAQIHVTEDRQVLIFSRNGEDKTSAFPDVCQLLLEATDGGAKSLILDAELVAIDRADSNRLRAFQELSTRARSAVTVSDVTIDVAIFMFDLLYVDGESLLREPLRVRREKLSEAVPGLRAGFVEMAQSIEVDGSPVKEGPSDAPAEVTATAFCAPEEAAGHHETKEVGSTPPLSATASALQEFLLESFVGGAEGLMVKQLDAGGYQPSKRSESWLKVKKDYCEGMRDSLDLVPIGAWHGNGRKAGWLSPFLLAAWDPVTEEFQSVCRVMSGFTDQFYIEATERLGRVNRIDSPKPYYITGESCSVWFEPTEVWEIRGADLTISPVHKAARGHLHPDKGISMRFPRFIRMRPDKTPQEASGPEVIVDLFQKQTRKVSTKSTTPQSIGQQGGDHNSDGL